MPRQPDNWERMELERLLDDVVETESGNAGARHTLLIAALCALGYMVSNTARAITLAEKVLYGVGWIPQ